LNLVCIIQFDAFQFYALSCKWHYFILLYGWVTFHDIYHVFYKHSTAVGNPVWFNNLMTGGGGSGKVENMGFCGSAPGERVAQDHWFTVNDSGLKAQEAVLSEEHRFWELWPLTMSSLLKHIDLNVISPNDC
jgi:hypothetical protein